jgi:hypothetical protein
MKQNEKSATTVSATIVNYQQLSATISNYQQLSATISN